MVIEVSCSAGLAVWYEVRHLCEGVCLHVHAAADQLRCAGLQQENSIHGMACPGQTLCCHYCVL